MIPFVPAIALLHVPRGGLKPYRPTPTQVAASYERADKIGAEWLAQTAMLRLDPNWLEGGAAFWYRHDNVDGSADFRRVDARTGVQTPLFDPTKLADALGKATGKTYDAKKLPFRTVSFTDTGMKLSVEGFAWTVNLTTYAVTKGDAERRPTPRSNPWVQDTWPPVRRPSKSPDGKWSAQIVGANVTAQAGDGSPQTLTTDGTDDAYYARLTWAPNSQRLIAVRVHPGDRKKVALIQTSPPTWGPAKVLERIYDRPGDKVDTFDIVVLDPSGVKPPVKAETIDYGDLPNFRPTTDGAFTFDKMDRGYGRWRVFRLDPESGTTKAVIDDDPATFVDSTALINHPLEKSDEILYSSERDGWHHLYLADGKGGSTQITRGEWIVREIVNVDEAKRQLIFQGSGKSAGEDPYYTHYYRVSFDGTGLVDLTPEPGNHRVALAPDGLSLLDTVSTPTDEPVYRLRNAMTGQLVAVVDRADVSKLRKGDWRAPQPFVAKGRDGKTDIYGLVFRPSHFDPKKSYPVLEDIYAGPQDSFVPKSFLPNNYDQRVAELGFIVVKIDGMGTRNRSKAFHDVCYQNLADAGFPDRILWMKALAKTDRSVDLDRVGIFGTSAGGQNSTGGVLFHPEFYKAAVSSCGCHDNRLDKIWWNEQWMGLIGPHYEASSNIVNAGRLQGKLLLMVGELDTNVPTESTYRLADALQKAKKDFDFVVITNSDHTAGGDFGERKRRDFFVRNLLGVEPPNPNGPQR